MICLVASVCPFIRPFVCLCSPAWTVWHTTLIFGMVIDRDLGYAGIVGKDCKSKVKVKPFENVFWCHFVFFQRVLRSRSRPKFVSRSKSKVKFKMSFSYWCRLVDSGTWLCQVQQKVQWNTGQVPLPVRGLYVVICSCFDTLRISSCNNVNFKLDVNSLVVFDQLIYF